MGFSVGDILCCFSILITWSFPVSTTVPLEPSYLLPNHVAPYRYRIYLDVRFQPDFKYYGSEYIYVRIEVPTSEITLHVNRALVNISICNIEPATEFQPKQTGLDIMQLHFSESEQRLTLKLNQILEKNENYRIYFEFSGFLNQETTDSFYVLKYLQDKYVASTVFEPNLARTVFPCFDEPHYKSYFILMIRRPHYMTALSNMPVEKTVVDGEYRVDHFQESLLMSSYLLCFAIGTFDSAILWNNATQYKIYVARNSSDDFESNLRESTNNDSKITGTRISDQIIEQSIEIHTNRDIFVRNTNKNEKKRTNHFNSSNYDQNITQSTKNNYVGEELSNREQPIHRYDSINNTQSIKYKRKRSDFASRKQRNSEIAKETSFSTSGQSSNDDPVPNNEQYSKINSIRDFSTSIMSRDISTVNSSSGESTIVNPFSGGVASSQTSPDNVPEGFIYYLNTSVRLVHYLESQLGVEYKMPKLDLLFLPGFRYEALENWGLISVNARYQITNRADSSHKVLGTRVLAHELAHNWFGNLVSVKRWSEIWISEGLANFYTVLSLDYLEPQWQFGLSQVARSLRLVMKLESQPHKALPLNLTWDGLTPNSLFNHAVYEKSFCVLRMINYTLGEHMFTKSIQTYLRSYQFRSTTADDLLDAFDQTYNEYHLDKNKIGRSYQSGMNRLNGFDQTSIGSNEPTSNIAGLNRTPIGVDESDINLDQAKSHTYDLDQRHGPFNQIKKASSEDIIHIKQNKTADARPKGIPRTLDVINQALHFSAFASTVSKAIETRALLDNSPAPTIGSVEVSLKEKMQTWISNPGYPLVKVIRGYDSGQLFISQERFQKSGSHTPVDPTKWWIPLTWFSESEHEISSIWFNPGKEMLVLTTQATQDEWIIFNYEFSGLYSVVYDARNYALLASYMNSPHNFSRIPSLNRIQLLSDLVLFTKYKFLGEDILIEHLRYFQYETESTVWATFGALLKDIRAIFNQSVFWKDFQDLMSNISPIRSDLNVWSFDKVQTRETFE